MRLRAPLAAAALAVLLALGAVAPASAAPGPWSPPVDVGGLGSFPQVAVSSAGTFVAVWSHSTGSGFAIQASHSADGLTWGPTVDIQPATVTGDKYYPQLAIDPAGVIHAVWQQRVATEWQVYYSQSADAVAWSTPVQLSSLGGQATTPQIATGNGGVTVVWAYDLVGFSTIEGRYSPDSGTTWGGQTTVSFSWGTAPQIVTTPAGRSTVVWASDSVAPAADLIDFATFSANFVMVAAGSISDSFVSATAPQIVLLGNGDVVASYESGAGIGAVVGTGGVSWSTPTILGNSYGVQLAAHGADSVTAVWTDLAPPVVVQSATSTDGGATWTPAATDLSPDSPAYDPQVAIAPDGTIAVIWNYQPGSDGIVQSTFSLDGGSTWSAPDTVSTPSYRSAFPALAAAPDGRFVSVWPGYTAVSTVGVMQVSVTTVPAGPAGLPPTGVEPLPLALGALVLVGLGMLVLGIRGSSRGHTQKRRQTEA